MGFTGDCFAATGALSAIDLIGTHSDRRRVIAVVRNICHTQRDAPVDRRTSRYPKIGVQSSSRLPILQFDACGSELR